MTSEEYCYQKAAPKGSAFYFSLSSMQKSGRDAVVAIAAFYEELNDIVFECHDPAVAHAKFSWWRTEAAKLTEGKSDHPVILSLQKYIPRYELSPQRFIDMIDGIEQNINLSPFPSFEDITLNIIHTVGIRELLIADVLKQNETISAESIYSLSLVMELIHHLQYLHRDVSRGCIFFGEDELQKFQVTSAMLQEYKTTELIRALLQYQYEKIERAYNKAQTELSHELKKNLASTLIRCECAMAVLREIQKSQFNVLENLIHITPLRRWWISFRYNSNQIS